MAVNWMSILHAAWRRRGLVASAVGAALVMVILVPLPASLMDLLLLANIGLAVVILLTALQVRSPLEFSVLPSVLLGATLFRLVLNVATTRLILTAGGGASASAAELAAGKVVWTFASFVTHGSLAVGAILFAILIVIQFLVVTKGATRISEVAARFVLDAMPGKQMAIDADLANKSIDAAEARRRREQIVQEADFYGAMDGASKFMRGDALAALAIVLVNLVGGICVGTMQYGWDLGATVNLFTRLTLGEGLVMQIPAFLVSIAAALLITRSTRQMDFVGTVASQLLMRPPVLISTAIFLGLLALTPLPTLPLLLMGGSCIGLASVLSRREQAQGKAQTLPAAIQPALPQAPSKGLQDLMSVDQLQLEIGYAMVRLLGSAQSRGAAPADLPQGDLLEQIANVRRQMAAEAGLLVPPIRIRDNMDLQAHSYVLKLRGVKVAQGRCYPNQLLALAEGKVTGSLEGRPSDEPGLGAAGVWILPDQRKAAAQMGYRVIDPAEAVGLHLAHVLRRHGAELLSRQQVAALLDALATRSPALVAEVRERFKLSAVQKVLQNLLRERVPVHDLEGILEAMSDWPGEADELWAITEHVRGQLAAALSQQYASLDGKLRCVALAPELEQQIARHLQPTSAGNALDMDPQMSGRISQQLCDAIGKLRSHGHRGVVLCSPAVRSAVRQLVAVRSDAAVLAYSEVESVDVQTLECVGLQT